MYKIVQDTAKSTDQQPGSWLDDRRPPVVQNPWGIDDHAWPLASDHNLTISEPSGAAHYTLFSRDRRRSNPTIATCESRSTLTDSALRVLRYSCYHTGECLSSSPLCDGPVKALRVGAVNHRTTSRCWQAGITLSGRNLTPKQSLRRCALC